MNNVDCFILENDPDVLFYKNFKQIFGNDEVFVIAIKRSPCLPGRTLNLVTEIRVSKKLKLKIRRIVIAGVSYTRRPSFAMTYIAGFVKDVEKPSFFRKFAVSF